MVVLIQQISGEELSEESSSPETLFQFKNFFLPKSIGCDIIENMLDMKISIRTCPHRVNVRIIRHNFVGDKAKIRRRAVALQGFLTQAPAKFDEKTCMNPYVDRFL